MYIIEIYDRAGRVWNELKRFNSTKEFDATIEFEKTATAFPSWVIRMVQVVFENNSPE